MINKFHHLQSSHCETGTLSGLLNHYGIPVSESLAFGIGSGLYFAYNPIIKYNACPLTTFRILPGSILKNFCRRTKLEIVRKKNADPKRSMDELDSLLEQNIPVGLLTNIFFLPYFPEYFRFHYNNHNSIVYAKEGNEYLISDPILEEPVRISYADLMKARYSLGLISLKGNIYYFANPPEIKDLKEPVIKGIKATSKDMLNKFVPYHGLNGITYLSKQVGSWHGKIEEKDIKQYLGNIIRMQEEIGTGGAGFRFIYAAFLQEAAQILKQDWLNGISKEMTEVGGRWREFSYYAATVLKSENISPEILLNISNILNDCALREKKIFQQLSLIS